MVLESTKLIRKLAGPNLVIFNDRLIDGTRSYKVWGWGESDYEHAVLALKDAGFDAELITYNGYSARSNRYYFQPRIYVGPATRNLFRLTSNRFNR